MGSIRKMQPHPELLPLEILATQMHEFFTVLMQQGFTEDQALKLLALRLEQGDNQHG